MTQGTRDEPSGGPALGGARNDPPPDRLTLCVGRNTIARLARGEAVDLGHAVLLPADDFSPHRDIIAWHLAAADAPLPPNTNADFWKGKRYAHQEAAEYIKRGLPDGAIRLCPDINLRRALIRTRVGELRDQIEALEGSDPERYTRRIDL